jgi:hypothetical protein
MRKTKRHGGDEMLRVTPISRVSAEEIWNKVVTPMVKGLIGRPVRKDPPTKVETTTGKFPGDEASNLNHHKLYGGQEGYVRYPYVRTFWKTENGAFVFKRDGVKIEAFCWYGDVESGKAGELLLKVGLRDRRYDGTKQANDSALLEFGYDDPVIHKPLSPDLQSVEISIYSFMPGSRILDATGEEDYDAFIKNPFTFLDRPEQFLTFFRRAWKSKRSPGQYCAPIGDVSKLVLPALEKVAREHGYDACEAAASHYHVARWFVSSGYQYTNPPQEQTLAQFTTGLEKIRASGTPLTRPQQSWVCVIQSLRPVDLIPASYNLNGPLWPQTNLDNACLWVNKPLTDKAKAMLVPKKA